MIQRLLLASHGSAGALVAEQAAINLCKPEDELDHLYVVPSWWASMTGDDWLNNGASRNRFRDYLSETLWQESQEVISRVRQTCAEQKINYCSLLLVGESEQSLRNMAGSKDYQKIILGSRRPRHIQGIRDRMLTNRLQEHLGTKLCIITHPNES